LFQEQNKTFFTDETAKVQEKALLITIQGFLSRGKLLIHRSNYIEEKKNLI